MHVVIAGLAIAGLPHLSRPAPEMPEVIPVEFVAIGEENTVVEPAPEETAPPEPEPAATRQAPSQADAVPLPDDKPAPPEPEAPAPDPKPAPPQPRPDVTPRSKPKPPSRFDASRVAALIDRSLEEAPAPAETAEDREKRLEEAVERQQPSLQDRIATATLQAAIRQKVQNCWIVPAGAKDVAEMSVGIRIQLRPDGTLARPPQFVRSGDMGNEFYRIFAESARRAVQNCEPYDTLPVAQYDRWRLIDFTFDASQMLGG